MTKIEKVKLRKLALTPVILYSLAGTIIIVGVLLVIVLLGLYGSTSLTLSNGRSHAFTILYAYWLTRRIIGILISVGIFILVGTYMVHKGWITT